MKKRKFKKNTKVILIIITIIIGVLLAAFYLINNFSDKKRHNSERKILDEIIEYGYILEENETELYAELFTKLSKVLSKDNFDEKEYAELITKLFVADFYNLENKVTKNDLGGTQFIYKDALENFVLKATDTFYKGIESNIYNDRKQELPIVNKVELVSINTIEYTINDKEVSAYSVILDWNYETDLGYETKKEFILIKENKKLSIVQMNDIKP